MSAPAARADATPSAHAARADATPNARADATPNARADATRPAARRELTDAARPAARRELAGALFVGALGLSALAGAALEPLSPRLGRALGGFGKLSLASPYPKVFCKVGSEEPLGYDHRVEVASAEGEWLELPLDREHYARWRAPYALRNVYGAALSFAPLLPLETTRAVIARGFCEDGRLLPLAGDERPRGPIKRVRVLSTPRPGALGAPRSLELRCSP